MGSAASVSESPKTSSAKPPPRGTLNFGSGDILAVFAEEMISRSPKEEGLTHLLESEKGRESFNQFLRNEYVHIVLCSFISSFMREKAIRVRFLHFKYYRQFYEILAFITQARIRLGEIPGVKYILGNSFSTSCLFTTILPLP